MMRMKAALFLAIVLAPASAIAQLPRVVAVNLEQAVLKSEPGKQAGLRQSVRFEEIVSFARAEVIRLAKENGIDVVIALTDEDPFICTWGAPDITDELVKRINSSAKIP